MNQLAIAAFGLTAMWLALGNWEPGRKYAALIGLAGQPFWIYFAGMTLCHVFITDLGEVRAGTKTVRYIADKIAPGLAAGKRTKKYQRAAEELRRLEDAIDMWASIYWADDSELEWTP